MTFGFWILALLLSSAAHAQITVSCRINPSTAAQYEEISAVITVGNNTGTDLELFTSNAVCDVLFEVRDQDNVDLLLTTANFIARPVRLGAGESLTITNNLLDFFDMRKIGDYKVYGKAIWEGKAFVSERAFLDIVPGIELQRAEAGLPAGGSRQYTLRMLNRERFDRLLLRVDDDAGGVCYGVFDLGRWVHTAAPELKVDGQGNVHVLYQSGPAQFVHRAFSPFGQVVAEKTYSQPENGVRLENKPGGAVEIVGDTPEEAPAEEPAEDGGQTTDEQ